jgi:hypothetical protein
LRFNARGFFSRAFLFAQRGDEMNQQSSINHQKSWGTFERNAKILSLYSNGETPAAIWRFLCVSGWKISRQRVLQIVEKYARKESHNV